MMELEQEKAPNQEPNPKPKRGRNHPVRGADGKFVPLGPRPEDLWKENSAAAFFAWLAHHQPQILLRSGRYGIFQPTDQQKDYFEEVLKVDDQGNFKHTICVNIQPRRHSKSVLVSMLVLWLFTTRENWTCQLMGSGEDHCRRVMFNPLIRIITHTPKLTKLLKPEKNILQYEIRYPERGNIIQRMTGLGSSQAFGDRLSCLVWGDAHSCPDLSSWQAYQAALLDSEGSLCFVDSNVDTTDGHVHQLQKQAEEDPSIFAHYVSYRDIEDYCARAPAWIDRQKARRLERTALPADFKRDILGQRSDAKNALFSAEIIESCKELYRCPVDNLKSIVGDRKYVVGSGLDRSRPWSIHGDATIWTTVAKVASPETGEPMIYVLNEEKIFNASAAGIKKAILQDNERYGLNNISLESFETSDIAAWVSDQGLTCEVFSPTSGMQQSAFSELRRVAAEGRVKFPESLTDLQHEMSTFIYTLNKGGRISFGHDTSRHHDDRVYALCYAVYALRETVLSLYTLGHIECHNKTFRRNLCFLMGGDASLFCCQECSAFHQVDAMWKEYRRQRLDDDINIAEFFVRKVRVEGAVIYQAI